MKPAVVVEEEWGLPQSPLPGFKWTGNANMATVGEWKRSGGQATGSAGGGLSVGGVLEEEEGGGLLGWRDCTNILSHYPDSFIILVMYGWAWRGKSQMASHPTLPPRRHDCSRVMTRSNLLHQKP